MFYSNSYYYSCESLQNAISYCKKVALSGKHNHTCAYIVIFSVALHTNNINVETQRGGLYACTLYFACTYFKTAFKNVLCGHCHSGSIYM